MGVDRIVGEAITTHIPSNTRADILLNLLDLTPGLTKEQKADIGYAVAITGANRTNRNILVHSVFNVVTDGAVHYRVSAKGGKVKRGTHPVGVETVRTVADEMRVLFFYLNRIYVAISMPPEPWPERPPRPLNLPDMLEKGPRIG